MEFGDEVVREGSAGGDFAESNAEICNNVFTSIRLFWFHSKPSLGQEHNVWLMKSFRDRCLLISNLLTYSHLPTFTLYI